MKKKILATVLAAALCIGIGIGGTLAWLTDKTDSVVNTFTVGNINIDLTETFNKDEDKDGTVDTWEKKMVPGSTLDKDPKVTVEADSEACYLFLKVIPSDNLSTYISYELVSDWKAVPNQNGYYYQEVSADDAADGKDYKVLIGDSVTVLNTVTKENMDALNEEGATLPTLTFVAAAVQSENLATVTDAFAQLPTEFLNA